MFLADKDDAFDAFKIFCKKENDIPFLALEVIVVENLKIMHLKAFVITLVLNINSFHPELHNKMEFFERKNRSIREMAWTMLNENAIPNYLRAEAVNTTRYVLNGVLIRPYLNKTPY